MFDSQTEVSATYILEDIVIVVVPELLPNPYLLCASISTSAV